MMHQTGGGSGAGTPLLQVSVPSGARCFAFLLHPHLSAAWQSFRVGCERGDHPPRAANPSMLVLRSWKEGE